MSEQAKPEQVKSVSKSEFLQSYSLYRRADFKGDWSFPHRIQWHCGKCEAETTWSLLVDAAEGTGICSGSYRCGLCNREVLCFYLYNDSKKGSVYKTGQYPEPSTAVAKPLARGLKNSLEHYKKGLICFNQGYGIGAAAYFRRVVEERTNELIDVVADLARANGTGDAEVERILAAKFEKTYDKRLEVASELIPASLRPGGANPLGRLHGLLSGALHAEDEAGALRTAEEMRFILEHFFINLKDFLDSQREYARRLQQPTTAPASAEITNTILE